MCSVATSWLAIFSLSLLGWGSAQYWRREGTRKITRSLATESVLPGWGLGTSPRSLWEILNLRPSPDLLVRIGISTRSPVFNVQSQVCKAVSWPRLETPKASPKQCWEGFSSALLHIYNNRDVTLQDLGNWTVSTLRALFFSLANNAGFIVKSLIFEGS